MITIFWVKFSFTGPITFANLIALASESQKKGWLFDFAELWWMLRVVMANRERVEREGRWWTWMSTCCSFKRIPVSCHLASPVLSALMFSTVIHLKQDKETFWMSEYECLRSCVTSHSMFIWRRVKLKWDPCVLFHCRPSSGF